MMIEKELADRTLELLSIFVKCYGDKLDIMVSDLAFLFSRCIEIITAVLALMIVISFVYSFILNFLGNKHTKKMREFELLQAEKESYYWTVISQCADIQLQNLLDQPLKESSRMRSDAMDLTREHFEPRKGVIHRDDYD